MKTPEEIKKGLECCLMYDGDVCELCPYRGRPCHDDDEKKDALAYIQQLEAQLVNQATEYSQALKNTTAQRDAAIADLKEADVISCEHCRWKGSCSIPDEDEETDCEGCRADCRCRACRNGSNWEWRGPGEIPEKAGRG